jgi:hypothetical protein
MKAKSVLLCLVAALTLGACAGQKPLLPECGGNNCRHEKPSLEPV